METFTVSFFGHRYIDNFRRTEERVERQVRQLIEEHEFVEFLVGRDGDFDQIVSSAVIRAKKNIRDATCLLLIKIIYHATTWAKDYLTKIDSSFVKTQLLL